MTELKKKAERFKKTKVQDEMYFDQEKQMFCEQLKAVRNALKSSQVECDMVKRELDKEVLIPCSVGFCCTTLAVSTIAQYVESELSNKLLGWLISRVVSMLDSGAEGHGFKSQLQCCRVTVLGKLFAPIVPLLLMVVGVTAVLVESNGSLLPGL